jgi:hypothetical protein
VEIRRILVWGQLKQKVQETLSQQIAGFGSVCLSSQLLGEGGKNRRIVGSSSPAQA